MNERGEERYKVKEDSVKKRATNRAAGECE